MSTKKKKKNDKYIFLWTNNNFFKIFNVRYKDLSIAELKIKKIFIKIFYNECD